MVPRTALLMQQAAPLPIFLSVTTVHAPLAPSNLQLKLPAAWWAPSAHAIIAFNHLEALISCWSAMTIWQALHQL
jgi:hypothetical protein